MLAAVGVPGICVRQSGKAGALKLIGLTGISVFFYIFMFAHLGESGPVI